MNTIEFKKIWNALQKEENKVVGERAERLGKKMRIRENDIKLFKLSLYEGMK